MSETATLNPVKLGPEINKVTTIADINSQLRQGIEETLKEVGVPSSPNEGLGPATEEPVLSHETAKQVGATNVGSEKFSLQEDVASEGRRLGRIGRTIARLFVGGNDTSHIVPGNVGGKLFRNKPHVEGKNKYDSKEIQELE